MSIWPWNKTKSVLAYWMTDCPPIGYHRLIDSPEVGACVDTISGVISSATIYLMRNTPKGDVRQQSRLSRFVDIDPWPSLGTRSSWMSWIVSTMLTDGDGNAYVLPHFNAGEFSGLEPMPGAAAVPDPVTGYKVHWKGRSYEPDDILHFRINADLDNPWKGRGLRVRAERVAESLAQTEALKASLSSPKYKPPLVVMVNSDGDLSDPEKREEFRKQYLEDTDSGKPWILPAELMKVVQVKPLTLTDLAVRDTVELDKKSIASIFGIPLFLLGLGTFNEAEYNNFIRRKIIPICVGIEQELTLKLLSSEKMYFKFNRKHLYAYDMTKLVQMDLTMSDRGIVNGDEVRADAFMDPAGLTEFRPLENYIPYDMAAAQSKLQQDSS